MGKCLDCGRPLQHPKSNICFECCVELDNARHQQPDERYSTEQTPDIV